MTEAERNDRYSDGCDQLKRRRYDPCRCDAARGACYCEDDGEMQHSGVEWLEWSETAPPFAHRVHVPSEAG